MRLALGLLVLAGLVAGTAAVAQGGPSAPRSARVLHLPGDRACHGARGVTLRITLPESVQLGWLSVRRERLEVVRLTGVTGDASVTVRLPRDGARLTVAAEALDGTRLEAAHSYGPCPRGGRPPVVIGGGEA